MNLTPLRRWGTLLLLLCATTVTALGTLHRDPAALLSVLLAPVLVVFLCITLIGIAAVLLVAIVLLGAVLFGTAVVLAWLGQRVLGTHTGPAGHPALAVLVGGLLLTLLYLVPVIDLLVYKLLGIMGLGVVVYTVITLAREHQTAKAAAPVAQPAAARPNAAQPAAAQPTAALPRAGFWIRMAALLLDLLLVGAVAQLLHPVQHLHLPLLAAYGAVMWKTRGCTVGGMVFDLQVVRLDGRAIDWETALLRALGCLLSLVVAGLGFLWIAFDPGRQAWHDKIAGTAVVRVRKFAATADVRQPS